MKIEELDKMRDDFIEKTKTIPTTLYLNYLDFNELRNNTTVKQNETKQYLEGYLRVIVTEVFSKTLYNN